MSDQVEPAKFYDSTSKGRVRIKGMEWKWLKNSLNILETRYPNRQAEILGMRAEVARLDAEYAAQQTAPPPASRIETFEKLDDFLAEEGILVEVTARAQARIDAFEPNPRAEMGGNMPPEEMVTADGTVTKRPDIDKWWSIAAILERNTGHVEELGKVKADAAAIVAIADDAAAETAATIVQRLRKVRTEGEAAFTAEKAPILAAGRICDDFGRPFKGLETEQKRIERLIGSHSQKVAEDRRQALAKAAADEKAKADELIAMAAQQETAGNDVVAEILMDHAQKAETFGAIHTKAAEGLITDLGRTVTATANIILTGPWTAEITDLAAMRASCGPLGAFLTPDAMLTAAKAYVRANVSDKKFVGDELAGVRIFQDIRASVRG